MSYANVKAFILILVVMAVPAAIRAAPFSGGFQAPAIPAVPMPGMQTPFTERDSLASGQAQLSGSSAFRGPMSAQNLQGFKDIGIDPKDFTDSGHGSGPMAVPSGFNDLGLGSMMGGHGTPDARALRAEFDALVRSVGTMDSNGMSSQNIKNIGFKPSDFSFIPGGRPTF
ncbi:hypothetical protein RvY_14839 [Ramazzottius varieornatus]|uniref:Uncharacterized protein n=1 Tax=Ramazzottius varieornatus TaxID=947166 RepID=A0A1D1VWD5_RAMVA|nr:hypothetical protein RvY_14839 [Ramazzottius varieornatus]